MTLIYTFVFGVTIAELFLLFLVLLPLGVSVQKRLFNFLEFIQTKLRVALYVLFFLVFMLFLNDLNTSMHAHDEPMNPVVFNAYTHCKVFYAQRNMYMTTITLLVGFILYRIPKIVSFNDKNKQD